MTFGTFILIVVAVALGVRIGLKLHEDPHYYDNLLELIWLLIKGIFILGVVLGAAGLVIYGIRRLFERGDSIDTPDWLDKTISVAGLSVIIGATIWGCALSIKEKGGLKKWWQNRKETKKKAKQAQKDRIAKMSKKELKEYKKSKRPGIRFWILIAFPAAILICVIIALVKFLISY